MTAVLEGLGGWLPPTVVTNEDLSRRMDTTPEWIESRTGIRERRFAEGMGTADLAVAAGARALRSAGRSTVDAVVVATTSPDRICPAAAPEVASRLDLGPIAAHDLTSACSGFPYGLATGAGLLATGIADSVLVIGAEVFSTFVNQQDRATAPLFGDGAGAVVLRTGTSDEYGAISPPHLGSDGARANLLAIPAGGSRQRSVTGLGHNVVAETEWYLGMAGQALYQHAVNRMAESARTALDRAGWTVRDVDRFVGHQANIRILHSVADDLELPRHKTVVNIDRVGNTLAASIPLALCDAANRGDLVPGSRVLLTAFGAGLSWGSAVLTWPEITAHGPPTRG